MDMEYENNSTSCYVIKAIKYLFLVTSIFLFFSAGRCFEGGYYGAFGWYIIGGIISYTIYWLSFKQQCWVQLKDQNISYDECCIKRDFVNAEQLSND